MENRIKEELSEEEARLLDALRRHPELREQMAGLLEEVEDEQEKWGSFDEVEELVVARVRELGRLGLQGWAQKKAAHSGLCAPEAGARRGDKKK